MGKKITLTNGVSAITVPTDVRVTGVIHEGNRLPYRLTKERNIETRDKVTGVVEVTFAKIALTTRVEVPVAAAWPLTPTEPNAAHAG